MMCGHNLGDHVGFWRLAQALFEVLPRDTENWQLGQRPVRRAQHAADGCPSASTGAVPATGTS